MYKHYTALAHNMKSNNVHDFPMPPQQQQNVCFLLLNSFFHYCCIGLGKRKKMGLILFFLLDISELFNKYNLIA